MHLWLPEVADNSKRRTSNLSSTSEHLWMPSIGEEVQQEEWKVLEQNKSHQDHSHRRRVFLVISHSGICSSTESLMVSFIFISLNSCSVLQFYLTIARKGFLGNSA